MDEVVLMVKLALIIPPHNLHNLAKWVQEDKILKLTYLVLLVKYPKPVKTVLVQILQRSLISLPTNQKIFSVL